ncbi:MAG: pilus assembly protein PilM [Oligoflexia bacterium]|nr:pilus assembly protein PilM [Oligoflexia bacterium]
MRILGIDVGTASIKAVEFDSAFGRYEIHDYYEQPVAPDADLIMALSHLMATLPKQPDRVAIALKTGQVTFRNMKLPTRDRKSIQAGVGFELDDDLPFALENAAYDYSILSQSKQGTELHVAATLRSHLEGTINAWKTAGIDPDLITTESWAYRTLMNRVLSRAQQENPVILVHIGHEHTIMYVHWNGTPIIAREIGWGGRDMTEAIAKKYNLAMVDAERAKIDHGFVVSQGQQNNITTEQAEFSESLLAMLQTLIVELRQVELTCKSITHLNVSEIYLAGGSALLPGLPKVLEESIGAPVRPLQALSSIATSGVTYSEQTDASFVLAAALGLCMVGPERSQALNFRKGLFGKLGVQREFNLETLRRPLLYVGAIAGCLTLSLAVQSATYQSKLKDLDSQLEHNMKTFFGSISNSAVHSYLSNPSGLRKAMDRQLNQQRDTAKLAALNPHSPLDYLQTLSATVPSTLVTDLMEYHVGSAPGPYKPDSDSSAALTFVVSSPQAAEQLTSTLTGRLGLKRDKMEEMGAGANKQWKLTFTGKAVFEAGH